MGNLSIAQEDTIASFRKGFLDISYENDLFFGTDYYYSQGTHISFSAPFLSKSPVLFFFPKLFNKMPLEEQHSLMLAHDFYTPTDITADSILFEDRPYACSFYFEQKMSVYNTTDRVAIHTALRLGIFGPWALGEFSQKRIHGLSGSPEPQGWKNEIANDVLVNYSMNLDIGTFRESWLEIVPQIGVDVGTEKNQFKIGDRMRVGLFDSPLDAQKTKPKKFQLYSELSFEMRVVLYNAYLQGGLINRSSPHFFTFKEVQRGVASARAGFYLQFYGIRLGYTMYLISREFVLGKSHKWAQCELRILF